MARALLMVGDRLVHIAQLDYPLPYLRYRIAVRTSTNSLSSNSTTCDWPDSTLFDQTIIFRRHRQISPYDIEYQYETTEGSPRFTHKIIESIEWGLQEPDKNVNLKKLRKKLRSNKRMKKLLLQYYRS